MSSQSFTAPAASFTFDTFDAEGAGAESNQQGTYPQSINSVGSITGVLYRREPCYHGFLRTADATMVSFDVPGAGSGARQGTTPMSINREGAIAGYYADITGATRGFIRTPDGAFTPFGIAEGSDPFTFPNCINDEGAVVGVTQDGSGNEVAFLREADGQITVFRFPGQAWSVNASGTLAGTWADALRGIQGVFLRKSSGEISKFNVPGVSFAAINDADIVMGRYSAEQTQHGFVLASDGKVTTFDGPKAARLARRPQRSTAEER